MLTLVPLSRESAVFPNKFFHTLVCRKERIPSILFSRFPAFSLCTRSSSIRTPTSKPTSASLRSSSLTFDTLVCEYWTISLKRKANAPTPTCFVNE